MCLTKFTPGIFLNEIKWNINISVSHITRLFQTRGVGNTKSKLIKKGSQSLDKNSESPLNLSCWTPTYQTIASSFPMLMLLLDPYHNIYILQDAHQKWSFLPYLPIFYIQHKFFHFFHHSPDNMVHHPASDYFTSGAPELSSA